MGKGEQPRKLSVWPMLCRCSVILLLRCYKPGPYDKCAFFLKLM